MTGLNPFGLNEGAVYDEYNLRKNPFHYVTIDGDTRFPASRVGSTFLPKGLILAKATSDGKYHVIRGAQLSAAEASGQDTLSVDRTDIFAVGDNVYIVGADGSPVKEDLGAITAIDATSGTITVTTAITAGAGFAEGDYVYVAPGTDEDGQATAVAILDTAVQLLNDVTHTAEDRQAVRVQVAYDGGDLYDTDIYEDHLNGTDKAKAELETAWGLKLFV